MLWYILLFMVVYAGYKFIVEPLDYWKKRKVPYKKTWPLIGDMLPILLRKINLIDSIAISYNEFPDKRYSGQFQFGSPVLMIRDLELIKKITVKDFDHFTDHIGLLDENNEPIFGRNLFVLKGQRWRDMRAHLSPTFTSSKIKAMFHLMSECAKDFTKYFLNKNEEIVELEMKDVFSRFTNDVIASTAFGVKCDSLVDKDNEFFRMGKDIMRLDGIQGLKMLLLHMCPGVLKVFRIKMFPQAGPFFEKIIDETIRTREDQHIVRPDMIHLLMEAKKGKLKYEEDHSKSTETGFATVEESDIGKTGKVQAENLTNSDIAAQAMIFFVAGFETASTMMCFMAHELAENPDVQEKLQIEIDDTLAEYDGEVTYEAISKMKYLDMCISETLRKWPPAPVTDRVCTKDYIIEAVGKDESPFILEKGVSVAIPIRGLHYDPKFFPNPEKFDPERFSDENKGKIQPYSYMPFGLGPRNCIGSRFALLEIKIMAFHFLSKFNVTVVKKTCIPMKITKKRLKMEPDNGFWLGLQRR